MVQDLCSTEEKETDRYMEEWEYCTGLKVKSQIRGHQKYPEAREAMWGKGKNAYHKSVGQGKTDTQKGILSKRSQPGARWLGFHTLANTMLCKQPLVTKDMKTSEYSTFKIHNAMFSLKGGGRQSDPGVGISSTVHVLYWTTNGNYNLERAASMKPPPFSYQYVRNLHRELRYFNIL